MKREKVLQILMEVLRNIFTESIMNGGRINIMEIEIAICRPHVTKK